VRNIFFEIKNTFEKLLSFKTDFKKCKGVYMTKKNKLDRRTIYTVNTIKDSFLELINQEPYSQINVAKLCRHADMTRSTFYSHFDNLSAVLNSVLDDAMLFTNDTQATATIDPTISLDLLKENESLLPACQRIADSSK